MKLIIDVDEKLVCEGFERNLTEEERDILIRAIGNGIPICQECKTCRYRDPEDKKCDCGGLERQGALFPVSDDYFCKFYEKGCADCMDEDAKQASIPYTYNAPQHDWKCGYPIKQSTIWWNGYNTGKVIGEYEKSQGEWLNTSPYDDKGECSLCCYLSKKYYKYCPNCGAKMKGDRYAEEMDN